jgi:hypothetical protein
LALETSAMRLKYRAQGSTDENKACHHHHDHPCIYAR